LQRYSAFAAAANAAEKDKNAEIRMIAVFMADSFMGGPSPTSGCLQAERHWQALPKKDVESKPARRRSDANFPETVAADPLPAICAEALGLVQVMPFCARRPSQCERRATKV
jgi:hypothetical protein